MKCRLCQSDRLWKFLDLGNLALPRFPVKPDENVPHARVELVKCESCHLVQLSESVDRDLLFRGFWYRSSVSSQIRADLQKIALEAIKQLKLQHGDTVLDIGCNDGTLLSHFPKSLNRFGFEPASNLLSSARKHGRIIEDYFSAREYHRNAYYKADLITAIAMFYDVENPIQFCREIADCLSDEGIFIVQQNYLGSMLKNTAYDNVCHEHLTYFSLATLKNVLSQVGLEVYHVELNEINGGSFNAFIDHKGFRDVDYTVPLLEQSEEKQDLQNHKVYRDFSYRVRRQARILDDFLLRNDDVMIYGAGTRGATIFQFTTRYNTPKIQAAIDNNPAKQGRYYLDTAIPIVSPQEAVKRQPKHVLVLPYHLANEIVNGEKETFPNTRWIIPLPEMRVE